MQSQTTPSFAHSSALHHLPLSWQSAIGIIAVGRAQKDLILKLAYQVNYSLIRIFSFS